MSEENTSDSYEVGYGKPPRNTQFQKGVSGNPKGRPKKARDFDHELLRESRTSITINENGQPKRITKIEGLAKLTFNKAMTGSTPDRQLVIDHYQRAHERVALEAHQPNGSGKYSAKDFTEDQLKEIIWRGEEERKKLGLSNVLNRE